MIEVVTVVQVSDFLVQIMKMKINIIEEYVFIVRKKGVKKTGASGVRAGIVLTHFDFKLRRMGLKLS